MAGFRRDGHIYHNAKTMVPISTYLHILMPSYTVPYICTKFERNIVPAVSEIQALEISQVFFIFFV